MAYYQSGPTRKGRSRQSDWMKNSANNIVLDKCDYSGDATDEEQEDLPYDGDLERTYRHISDSDNLKDCTLIEKKSDNCLQLTYSEVSNHVKETNYKMQRVPQEKVFPYHPPATRANGIKIEMTRDALVSGTSFEKELTVGVFSSPVRNECFTNSKISDVLLHHFSKEELLSTNRLIDCETIPETSLTESVDEAILNKMRISECTKPTLLAEAQAKSFEEKNFIKQEKTFEAVHKDNNLLDENKFVIEKGATSHFDEGEHIQKNSQSVTGTEDTNSFQNTRKEHAYQESLFERTVSSHEFKYGQGQVHYCLPDVSKVASKVKIPKGNNNNKSIPIIKKPKPSPNLLVKSSVVKNVLETMNYFDSSEVKIQEKEMHIPELGQQLEMLTKQAETQNHIDHLRFDYKRYPPAESPNPNFAIHSGGLQSGRIITALPSPGAAGEIHCLNLNLLQKTTEGEKMSQMLKEQTEQLRAEVEDFYKCVTQAPSSQDHCLVLKQLKGYLDALERKYVATREEHRGLQLQNYKHNPISVGEFDPDRKVEGEIFRLGMLLEDVQEKMDDNLCSRCPSSLIRLPTSPSLSACESVVSSCSVPPESELVSSISDPPGRRATEVNFLDNKKDESTKKSWATEMTLEKNCLLSLYNDNWDPFTQVQLRLQERDASAYEQDTQPLEEARLLANNSSDVMQCFLIPEAENGVRGLELHRQPMLSYNHTTDQGKTEGQMKSPSKAKLSNVCNMEHNTVHLKVLQEQGNLVHPSNHCFHKIVENCPDECENTIHPRLKTQVSSKANRIPCSYVKKSKNMENRKTDGRESVSRQHSAFIQEKAMDLDLSDTNLSSDSEDISYCASYDNSPSDDFMEQKTKSYKPHQTKGFRCNTGSRDWFKCGSCKESIQSCATCRNKNLSSPQKKRIAAQSVSRNKQPDLFVCRLSEQQNLEVPKAVYSRMYDTVILSPQYLAIRKSHSSNSVIGNRYNSDTKTKILNSTLDHAIQTANSLKKTTERMVQAVSEDLAKVKTHQNKHF
ncbi:PREDICTED: protein AKNAD1 isoform X2 [Gavialis gangeticus]|uniref:protein AKNAD1 isoform X2 n=1 Tax=Gavialis gangeticus TaxID=94835 RepID=UPI00092E7BF0|nr:PREDICTED: protein AKNAD1 isoform X2 [Gavialis gangeticus]